MSERRAVVIGINNYKGFDLPLKGAENDAREVFARLQKFGNFNVDRKKHLLLGERAKCDDIRQAISDLFWKKDPCDIAVFYFSGHGFLDDYKNGYIAPWDHEYRNPLVHGIRMQELRQYFLAENNKAQALLILDCCHSGVTAKSDKDVPPMSGRFYDSLASDQAAVLGEGKFILASSGADETSREMCDKHGIRVLDKNEDELEFDDLEKHHHGVMTYHLLEGMDAGAVDGGKVRIGRLYAYVAGKMDEYKNQDDSHKDFKIYDCVASTYTKGRASETILLTASGKGRIDELIQGCGDFFRDTWTVVKRDAKETDLERYPKEVVNPYALVAAIRHAEEALSVSPENSEVKELVREIDEKLQGYRYYVNRWVLGNKGTYMSMKPLYKDEFVLLERELNPLCFQGLRKLNKEQGNLVSMLIGVALGTEEERSLTAALEIGPFKSARDQTGLAKADVKPGGPIQ